MHFTELDTPALCVDLDVLEKNIRDLQNACDQLEIGLRVHTKTHKTPAIARLQVAAGAIGIVSQKLGEAEAMADGGIQDILIPYNIVGQPKLARLTRLIQSGKSTLTLAADSAATVDGLSQAATTAGCRIRVSSRWTAAAVASAPNRPPTPWRWPSTSTSYRDWTLPAL